MLVFKKTSEVIIILTVLTIKELILNPTFIGANQIRDVRGMENKPIGHLQVCLSVVFYGFFSPRQFQIKSIVK